MSLYSMSWFILVCCKSVLDVYVYFVMFPNLQTRKHNEICGREEVCILYTRNPGFITVQSQKAFGSNLIYCVLVHIF